MLIKIIRKFVNDHVATTLVLLFLIGGLAIANLTSHVETTVDALLLALDSDADGTISDEAWYTAFVTTTEIGAAYDTAAELAALFAAKEDQLTNSAGLLAALSDETGTGISVFATSPTIVTPIFTTSWTIGAATIEEAEAEILDGATTTTDQLNYINTTTSDVQAQLNDKQATVTDGSLADGVVMTADMHEQTKWIRETFTSAADPYTITPAGGWIYKDHYCIVTTHQASVSLQLSEGGPPQNQCRAHIYIASGFDSDMADIDTQQELIPDGVTKTIEIGEWKTFVYENLAWHEEGAAANASFSAITTVETEFIPVGYMIDGASAPDALATLTSGTDKVNARTFAGDADEDLVFDWQVPGDLDTTTGIKFRVICIVSSATGPSTETWQFELHGFTLGDGDALNGTLGTAQTSNSGSRTDAQYDRVSTAWSGALTSTHITDLAVGETVEFKLYRDVDDTDDYVQNVAVVGIELKYKRDHDTTF